MKRVVFTVAALIAAVLPAAAQEPGDVGVVMGYPTSVGVIWHASDSIALRPEFNISRTSSENGTSGLDTSSWATSVGLSALLYTSTHDSLRTYISPRFTYGRSTVNSDGGANSNDSKSTSNAYQVSGSFGAQYALGSRLSVYGEVGFSYAHGDASFESGSPFGSASGTSTSDSFGTRSAVGVVLYFK